jgi:hypothetical protein
MSGRSGLFPRRGQEQRAYADGSGGNDDRGGLRGQAEAAPRKRSAEGTKCGALGPLAPRQGGALGAFAQVGAELGLLRARQRLVELLRDGELGLGARQRALELLAQRAPRAEDECLDRARREPEDLADLGVRASLDLA